MLLKNAIVIAVCGSILVSLPAIGQENPPKRDIGIETSVPFVENTKADGAKQSVSANYSPLNSRPLFFNKANGVESSYEYTQHSNVQLDGGSIGAKNDSEEIFEANVFQFSAKRWPSMGLGGVLTLDPRTAMGGRPQTQWGHPYGDASHVNLEDRTLPRTARRGSFYNSETFKMDGLNMPERFINREQPTVVFGYSF